MNCLHVVRRASTNLAYSSAIQKSTRQTLLCTASLRNHEAPRPLKATMSTRSSKRQRTTKDAPYELIYWPGIPGRAEHIRLALEEAGASYTDTALTKEKAVPAVMAQINAQNTGDAHNPPPLAPPILKHGDLTIGQTPNILMYLGSQHPALVPENADSVWHVNQLALTALDGLSNEAHDTHHPVGSGLFYEDQKPEAKRKSDDYRAVRLPKFLAYFERVLQGPASGGGEWLVDGRMSYADLVLFQSLDGVTHAFPKCVRKMREGGEYERVFKLYDRVKEQPRIEAYLKSEKRMKYGMGIYRHYPELDEE